MNIVQGGYFFPPGSFSTLKLQHQYLIPVFLFKEKPELLS